MGLTKCKECGGEVSKKAKACPKCGAPVKRGVGCGSLIAVLIILFIVVVIFEDQESKDKTDEQQSKEKISHQQNVKRKIHKKHWYSGGTLHMAKMKQWSQTAYANRLATSADFVTTMLQMDGKRIPPVDQLKPIAMELETCISTSNKGGVANTQKVSTMAAACWILMK